MNAVCRKSGNVHTEVLLKLTAANQIRNYKILIAYETERISAIICS